MDKEYFEMMQPMGVQIVAAKPSAGSAGCASDPICGNCAKAKSEHAKEIGCPELFCYMDTTGDIFTDEPRESVIFEKMMERHPDLYNELVGEWKRENGHA